MIESGHKNQSKFNLYSILISIILVSGSLRFNGISLIDEAVFLIFLILMYNYKEKNKTFRSSSLYINYYFKKANNSFNILFIYLFFSLILGLYYDPYFGKIRWAVILVGIVLVNKLTLFYLRDKLNNYSRLILLKKIHKYILYFCIFYVSYALFFKLFFGLDPAYIQSAQIEAWYAIWGTTAYTAIIFLLLVLYSKILYANKAISLNKLIFVYLLLFFASILFDSRVMLLILLLYLVVDMYQSNYKFLFMSIVLAIATILTLYFSQTIFMQDFMSSGDFLWQLLFDDQITTRRDFDRVAHYIAAFNTINNSFFEMIFGTGFLNAGKSIINEYYNVYYQYEVPVAHIASNISGLSKGTFGLSAFIIENGWLGVLLFVMHIYNMCMIAVKTKLIVPSLYIVATYLLLIFIMFTIYINDNMAFYLMLIPSIFIYPLISNNKVK